MILCKTTVAPNGTITEIVEAGGGGVEPIFAKYFVRRERSTTGKWKEWFTFNHTVRRYLDDIGVQITKENVDKYCTGPEWITAHSINNINKIDMMAEIQKYIDSAISITYNLAEDATPKDIQDIYQHAWEKEIKNVAVYREGSKMGVLITDANYQKDQTLKSITDTNRFSPKRPEFVETDIYQIKVEDVSYIILVGKVENKPYELFITSNPKKEIDLYGYNKGIIHKKKKGKYSLIVENGKQKIIIDNISKKFDTKYETLGRVISLWLRHGEPIAFLIDQLSLHKDMMGIERKIARLLKTYIGDNTQVLTSEKCPICDSTQLIYVGGCKSCVSCGWSKCD